MKTNAPGRNSLAQCYGSAVLATMLLSTAVGASTVESGADDKQSKTVKARRLADCSLAEPGVRNKPSDSDMPFYTIEKGTKSGIKSAERICVREEEEWLTLWRRHRAGSLVSDTAPPVDFEHNMVIAIFQGEGTNDSGFVEIDRVKLLPDKVLVIISEGDANSPKSESDRSTTTSFHIAKTSKNSLPVVFQ
jgi:hypothetical protein